jgi:ABC-type uncharacterized transport system substrate-binding protein
MDRRAFISGITGGLLAAPLAAEAQPVERVPQVGALLLGTSGVDVSNGAAAFRERLRELGWIEGRTVRVRLEFANRNYDRLATLAAQLARDNVDVIAAFGSEPARAAQQATRTVPIVLTGVGDPIRSGFVSNLARPGGNTTGVSLLIQELGAKRLELLKEVMPQLSRVAVLHLDVQAARVALHELQTAGQRLRIEVRSVIYRGAEALPRQIADIRKGQADALSVVPNPDVDEMRSRIAELALRQNLATVFAFREYVTVGGLMSYGPNLADAHRRAADHVDKILRGAKPGNLPVEQMSTFELVINLKTAKALGLTIPPSLLQRADQVIE